MQVVVRTQDLDPVRLDGVSQSRRNNARLRPVDSRVQNPRVVSLPEAVEVRKVLELGAFKLRDPDAQVSLIEEAVSCTEKLPGQGDFVEAGPPARQGKTGLVADEGKEFLEGHVRSVTDRGCP